MRIMRTACAPLILLTIAACSAWSNAAETENGIRAVIVTGVDWKGHIWSETSPMLRKILEQDGRFRIHIVENPSFLASSELFEFDEIVLHFKNYEPLDQEAKVKRNLAAFVKQGKGLVVVHYASGAFEDWPEFRNLVGRCQKTRHDKRGPFTVKIAGGNHPITKGMNDFQTDDELFIELRGDRPIDVLATARSVITGEDHPMAFAFEYGLGRVFHTTLGHDVRAITMPGTAELIRRGAAWAAGRGLRVNP
jgi:type 1 glutamine amidotransferase